MQLHCSLDGGPIHRDSLGETDTEFAFSIAEYQARVSKLRHAMATRAIDSLVVTFPPNVLYLSGFQTFSNYNGETLLLPIEGDPLLVVDGPEAGGALLHSWVTRQLTYKPDLSHESQLATLLADEDLDYKRIGVESGTRGVPANFLTTLGDLLPNVEIVDIGNMIDNVKAIKSPAEIQYIRTAAAVTDIGIKAAVEAACEGGSDNGIAAAASQAMISAGSEYMCLSPIVTSGPRSGILHTTHKRNTLENGDIILVEMGASYQRYTAPTMRTISIGEPNDEAERMSEACLSALNKILTQLRPGISSHEVAEAGWEAIRTVGAGYVFHGSFGYAVGAGFPPDWADGTASLKSGTQIILQPGMVFHHPIALRKLGHYGVAFSETSVITEEGHEVLTNSPRQLQIK